MQGIVVKFDPSKGFGFIRSKNNDNDIFVHIKNVSNASILSTGQTVEFKIQNSNKGQSAVSVVAGRKQQSPFFIFGGIAIIIIFIITTFLVLQYKVHELLSYLIAVNIATFIVYGYDKKIAGSDKLRVPESLLQVLALIGGSPAALVAQKFFRHKTIKSSFQIVYWIIVIVQVLGVLWITFKT